MPSALIIFGVTVSVRHTAGAGFGFGFTVGGLSGAGTTVTAESTLSAGFVSRPPLPVTVAVFVCDPTVVARPVIAIVTVCPASDRPEAAGDERTALRLQVPCDGLAVRYVMPAGAGSASWTFVAVSGPLFVTVSE